MVVLGLERNKRLEQTSRGHAEKPKTQELRFKAWCERVIFILYIHLLDESGPYQYQSELESTQTYIFQAQTTVWHSLYVPQYFDKIF